MTLKIEGSCPNAYWGELNVKRLRMPGVVLRDTCPVCKTVWTFDMREQYFSYPTVGDPIRLYAYCVNDDCQHEWAAGEVILKITLEIVP